MRCCLASLANFVLAHTNEEAITGTIVNCEYEKDPENAKMILGGDAVWRWNNRQVGMEPTTPVTP